MMLKPKYVAQNDITGIQVKTFYTKWGAKRWYNRPVKILGKRAHRSSFFLSVYEIDNG